MSLWGEQKSKAVHLFSRSFYLAHKTAESVLYKRSRKCNMHQKSRLRKNHRGWGGGGWGEITGDWYDDVKNNL